MAEIGDLPPELTGSLLELIILMGLDVINNAMHRSIWDAFSTNRRSERLPLNFQLTNAAKAFPKAKPKVWYFSFQYARNWMGSDF